MPTLSRPKVHVRPATPNDILMMNVVRDLAFSGGPISRALFHGPVDPATSAHRAKEMKAEMELEKNHFVVACLGEYPDAASSVASSSGPGDKITALAGGEALVDAAIDRNAIEPKPSQEPTLEVVDSAIAKELDYRSSKPGTVIGYVKWAEYLQERPAEEWDKPLDNRREVVGPGIDLDIYGAFIGGLRNLRRRRIQGKPHIVVAMVCTSPYHQRIGAGSALVSSALMRHDEVNAQRKTSGEQTLDCYLEASPPGYPVYARLGFEDLDVLDTDLKRVKIEKSDAERADPKSWGEQYGRAVGGDVKDGYFRTVLMIRSRSES